jgi:hypothetical protein
VFVSSLGLSGLLILALLGVWFLISIPNQLTNRYGAWVSRFDPFGFVPKWTFFAPIPGTFDYRLIYRDLLADGTPGEWQEVDWCVKRRWTHVLWHPRRLTTKLIMDSISGLGQVVAHMAKEGIDIERNPQGMIVSTPYVLLLNLVMAMPRQNAESVARQMAVFQHDPLAARQAGADFERMGTLILCSSAHDLGPQSPPEVRDRADV